MKKFARFTTFALLLLALTSLSACGSKNVERPYTVPTPTMEQPVR